MIANITPPRSETQAPAWHARFLKMMPSIRRHAQIKFRRVSSELREELIAETIANSLVAYNRLVQLGKEDVAFPSALARFATAQVCAGRRIGNPLNSRDVMSGPAQHRHGIQLDRLDRFDEQAGEWKEILVEDGRAGPAETAIARLDFSDWLKLLPRQRRKLALMLSQGESTSVTAKKFRVSASRISQIRQLLREHWMRFQGETNPDGQPQLAVA